MEPTSSPVLVIVESPSIAAIPKSVSSTCPSRARSTLPGFTSRCSTPALCAARRALRTWRPILAASRGAISPLSLAASASDGPSTYCMTIQGRLSYSTTSWTVTTPGWVMRAAARASFWVRACSTTRSASATYSPAVNSLTATVRCSTSSWARQTLPMPPRPRTSPSRYLPASTSPAPVSCDRSTCPRPVSFGCQVTEGRYGHGTSHRSRDRTVMLVARPTVFLSAIQEVTR